MIFLDLDGVVADLLGALAERHNVACPYDLARRATGAAHDRPFERWLGQRGLWERGVITRPKFWSDDIRPYPWALGLLGAVKKQGLGVRVCSNPGRDTFAQAAAAGKVAWVKQHLGIPSADVTLTREKWLLAAPGRVLIDDDERNIEQWRTAGGTGLLFPQPWNSNHRFTTEDPVDWVVRNLTQPPAITSGPVRISHD